METRFRTVLKILNPYVRTTNQANLPEVETSKSLCWDDRLTHARGCAGCRGNGVTAGRTNPDNRARFSDDARAQGKLPQINYRFKRFKRV